MFKLFQVTGHDAHEEIITCEASLQMKESLHVTLKTSRSCKHSFITRREGKGSNLSHKYLTTKYVRKLSILQSKSRTIQGSKGIRQWAIN